MRELENSIESAVVLARGEVVGTDALPLEVSRPPRDGAAGRRR
ncbi:MAG: hypothetical protein R3F43_32395 [bacterium]